jgi:hypothetical protein
MCRLVAGIGLIIAVLCAGTRAADPPASQALVLVDVARIGPATVESRDCRVEHTPAGLRLVTGTKLPFPGITLTATGTGWNLSARSRVEVDVKNTGSYETTIHCRVDNPGADGVSHCLNASISLGAGEAGTLTVPLPGGSAQPPAAGKVLFGMRGYPAEFGSEVIDPAEAEKVTFDPQSVNAVVVFVDHPTQAGSFEITALRAAGAAPRSVLSPDALFPLIDTFGQYIHRDWPGKTHSLAELRASADAEAADLDKHPAPPDRDQYGGWIAGPTLEKTGYFRVAQFKGKWWFVDPEGKLFFSNGIDGVGQLDQTAIEERDQWFADFPGNQEAFREFVGDGYSQLGHYAGRTVKTFSFEAANLKRRLGDNWRAESGQLATTRLKSWGLNTLGNWSDSRIFALHKVPYVVTLASGQNRPIEGSTGYWGKFVDPFDPAFASQLARGIGWQIGRSIGDPWCIGFFVGNELSWANSAHDETSLSLAALTSPADQPAKLAFIDDLKRKYGQIADLNRAWTASYGSWDALLQSRSSPNLRQAHADLAAFYSRIADRYFSCVHDAIRAAAPHQLYLGCRFAWASPRARAAAVRYCDVVSFNFYSNSEAAFTLPEGDMPVLIGEFHFGALDRGLFHAGMVATADQNARADAYRHFVLGALSNRSIVGCHWFQYQDEPTIGRVFDGENYQIGFVDVVSNPYPEIVRAAREVGGGMYATRFGAAKDK